LLTISNAIPSTLLALNMFEHRQAHRKHMKSKANRARNQIQHGQPFMTTVLLNSFRQPYFRLQDMAGEGHVVFNSWDIASKLPLC